MTDITELERRINAALDRIGQGVEALEDTGGVQAGEAAVDADEVSALREALEDERLANAQLEERVRAIKDKQDSQLDALRQELIDHRTASAKLDAEMQRLRKANDMLRDSNEALRSANEKGVGEPHLINKAMLAELESIRAARSAEAAESAAILGALTPLLAEVAQESDPEMANGEAQ